MDGDGEAEEDGRTSAISRQLAEASSLRKMPL